MKAVILAGGFGKRLRPYTDDKPKPLVELGGKAIIEWQIMWLKRFGITSIVILAGYKKEKLIEYLGGGKRFGVNIVYSIEEEPLGTAGAVKNAGHILTGEDFLLFNGDIISNVDLTRIRLNGETVNIALVPLKSPFGIVYVNENNDVIRFDEKPYLKEYWINAGIYLMSSQILDILPDKGDLEKVTFPELAKEGKIKGTKFDAYWRSVDTIKDMEEVSEDLLNGRVFPWAIEEENKAQA
ncbi:nucleotidyltransferase [Sulfolobales archaeon HS-7]|nr:nucleotidyltransferase [Sulfolobales archaeon HS-7]